MNYFKARTQMYAQAQAAILARHPTAYEIIHESGDSYSARVGGCIAYYTIRDGKIVGDVWME